MRFALPTLVAILALATPVPAVDQFTPRGPDAYECQGKVAATLAKIAGRAAKCAQKKGEAAGCLGEVLPEGRRQLLKVMEKAFERVTFNRCLTGVCGREDTPTECAATTLRGVGDPIDGLGQLGFQCIEKASKLLGRFAKSAQKCRREATKAEQRGQTFDMDGCVAARVEENVDKLAAVLTKLRDKGATLDRCLLRRECTPNDDVRRCAARILEVAGIESTMGAIGSGGGSEERAAQCRDDAADVLRDVMKAGGKCRAEDEKAARKGEPSELAVCLGEIVEKYHQKLAGHLAKAFNKGVTPNRCLDLCLLEDTPSACASRALRAAAGL